MLKSPVCPFAKSQKVNEFYEVREREGSTCHFPNRGRHIIRRRVREFHEWAECLNAAINGNVPKVSFLAKIQQRGHSSWRMKEVGADEKTNLLAEIRGEKRYDAFKVKGDEREPFLSREHLERRFSRRERERVVFNRRRDEKNSRAGRVNFRRPTFITDRRFIPPLRPR